MAQRHISLELLNFVFKKSLIRVERWRAVKYDYGTVLRDIISLSYDIVLFRQAFLNQIVHTPRSKVEKALSSVPFALAQSARLQLYSDTLRSYVVL